MKNLLILFLLFLLFCTPAFANTKVPATDVTVNASGFNNNLNPTDTDVQKSLTTIDQITIGGGGSPAGVNNQVQIKNGGSFGAGNMYSVGGNIGIGSVNPQQILDVNGSVILSNSTGGTITTLQSIGGQSSTNLTVTTGTSGTQTGDINIGQQSGASVNGNINITGQGTSGQTKGSDITITAGNGSSHKGIISITAPGNVGVGTIFPIQALDIIGTTRMTSFLMPTGSSSGYVLTSNSVGLGTWAPSTSGSGSGTVSSGTVNQEAVYTGSTTVGPGIITDNSTNIGIGTSSNTQAKLDVNGDISIRNNLSSVTAGQFKGVGAVWFPAWPGSGVEAGISSKKAPYDNSFASTSNGATGEQGLWNCNDHTQYDVYFSGVTQLPLSGAIYTNGSFNYHVKSSFTTSGSSGSFVGFMIVTAAGDLSASSGTLTLSSGTGDATLTYTSWDYNGCNGNIGFLGGISQIGDDSNPQYNSPALTGMVVTLDGNPANRMRPAIPGAGIDTVFSIKGYNISPLSSGVGYNIAGVDATGAVFDPVAMDWALVKSNSTYSDDAGYGLWVGNSGGPNMKGFIIASPGVAGISGDTGNTPFYVGDSVHKKSRFGLWQKFIATPDDVVYQFNGITGLSVLPSTAGSQYTISGDRCDVRDTSGISGGAGNIVMVCQGTTPSASGTLVRKDTIGPAGINYVSTGDATIAYTSVTKLRSWNDTLLIDQVNNNVGIGTSAPTKTLDVIGTVKALYFMGDGSGLTNVSGTGGASQWITGNVGIGTTSNVGIGTLQPSGLLTIGSATSTGRIFSITGLNSGNNGHVIQGDIDNKDSLSAADTIDFDIHAATVNYSNINELSSNNMQYCMNCSSLGTDLLSIGGAADIGVWSGGITHSAPSSGLVVAGNVGIGTWSPISQFEVGNRKLDVLSSGNVGIGSTNPGQKLDVMGTVRMTGFNLSTSPNNGYILTSDTNGNGNWQPVAGNVYGSIVNQTTFSSTTGYTNNGATVSASGGTLNFSGGAGTFTQSLDYNYYTDLDQWNLTENIVAATPGSSTNGMGIGLRSYNANQLSNTVCGVDLSTNPSAGEVYITTGTSNNFVALSTTGISFSGGDTIQLNCNRNQNIITATVNDVTNEGASLSVSYKEDTFYGVLPNILPTYGRFGIFSFGGAQKISSFSVSSNDIKNADIIFVGDSKTVGYYAPYNNGFSQILQSNYKSLTLAGGSETTATLLNHVAEIIALNPKTVVLNIGRNDVANSVPSGTYEANYSSIVSQLQAAGITVYNLLPLQEASLNQSTLNSFIIATYPGAYIDSGGSNYAGNTSIITAPDGVHPNGFYHSLIAQAIANFYAAKTNAAHYSPINSLQQNIVTTQGLHIFNNNTGTLSEQMTISPAGNVGIGSVLPGGALDVGSGTICLGHTCNSSWPSGSSQWTYTSSGNIGLSTASTVGIGTTGGQGGLLVMNGNVGIGTWNPVSKLEVNGVAQFDGSGNAYFGGNVGIGSLTPGQALDVTGTVRALSAGACTFLYKCVGGVDAGVIQTSACNLCPAGTCTQMNGCF